MDNHTLKVLEFDKVLRLIAKYVTSEPGSDALSRLYPSTDVQEIILKQTETSEMKGLLVIDPSFRLAPVKDLSSIFQRMVPDGAILNPSEIWSIEELLLESRRLKHFFQGPGRHFSKLEGKCHNIVALPELTTKISQTISPHGTMLDDGSWRLSSIRQRLKSVREQIKFQLEVIISSHLPVVQEPIITLRHNRYVILLKPEFKRRFSGIIHDQSASGATLFVEPNEIINENNRLIQLQLNEDEEIKRILAELTEQIKSKLSDIKRNLDIFGELDLILAKARFSQDFNGCEPELSQMGSLYIRKGIHPLLLARSKEKYPVLKESSGLECASDVVPIDIEMGSKFRTLLITGPNAGGKTVAIKTVGLAALMFQAGLHILAAEGSKLPVFKGIYADIGDEQSIEQNLSTFSAHVMNISNILKQADSESLIILDELGAGTDPEEGSALAVSILKHLHNERSLTVATSHYNSLKHFIFLHRGPYGMENASVEYDAVTLRPTYRLQIGQVGKSNALAVAAQAGFSKEIISEARKELGGNFGKIEDLIGLLEESSKRASMELLTIEETKSEIEKLKSQQIEIIQQLEKERQRLIKDFETEKERFLSEARNQIREIASHLRESAADGKDIKFPEKTLKQFSTQTLPILEESLIDLGLVERESIKLGDRVKVKDLKLVGIVVEDSLKEARVTVEVGFRRLKVPRQSLTILPSLNYSKEKDNNQITSRPVYHFEGDVQPDPGMELNVIGQTVEEACIKIDKFLDDAILHEFSSVRIIHGRGTGKLRQGIWEMLRANPIVKGFHLADFDHGGTAITEIELYN